MTVFEILDGYRKKLDSDSVGDRYAAFGFALPLPGICGRLEFEPDDTNVQSGDVDGKDALYKRDKGSVSGYKALDKNMFQYWFRQHSCWFASILGQYGSIDEMSDTLYDLRNSFTHEGIVKSVCGRIVLVDAKGLGGMETGRFLFLPIYDFCDAVFRAADDAFHTVEYSKHTSLEFSSFSGCGVDVDFYCKLHRFADSKFSKFWSQRSYEDRQLNMLYDLVFLGNMSMLTQVQNYFANQPDCLYVIEQFGKKYSHIFVLDNNPIFFEKSYPAYPWSKTRDDTYKDVVCRFSKNQFERMLVVHEELMLYADGVNDEIAKILEIGDCPDVDDGDDDGDSI